MENNSHIIRRQIVNLEIDSRLDAFAIQQDVSWILQNRVLPRMEILLDELIPEGVVWRLDQLELFLGELSSENLENQLVERYIEALTTSLIEGKIFTEIPQDLIIKKVGIETAVLEEWIFFLRNGHISWKQGKLEFDDWIENLIKAIRLNNKWLQGNVTHLFLETNVIKRLVWQFPDTVCMELFRALKTSWFSSFNNLYQGIFSRILSSFSLNNLKIRQIRLKFWEKTFQTLYIQQSQEKYLYELLKEWINIMILEFEANSNNVNNFLQTLVKESEVAIDIAYIEAYTNELYLSISNRLAKNKDNHKKNPGLQEESDSDDFSNSQRKNTDPAFFLSERQNTNTDSEGFYIQNAGVIILHPFLKAIFEELGYLEGGEFLDIEKQWRAVHLIQYLACGELNTPEYNLAFNKVICGLPLNLPIPKELELSNFEKNEADHLLSTVIDYWKALKNTSPDGLRVNYFMREGKLSLEGGKWKIRIEAKTQDILLNQLPWGISMVQLSWMRDRITIIWPY